jgi:tetrapyrrole methylase family protein/MazG family protein
MERRQRSTRVIPRITIVGLGPGHPSRVTTETLDAIASIPHRYLRTINHPSAHLVENALSFDHHYESGHSFHDVYNAIVTDLVDAAHKYKHILYAVPGSPLVLERTVSLLREYSREDRKVELNVLPAVSFLDDVWRALSLDPIDNAIRLIDGHTFATAAANDTGPLVVAHTHANWVLSNIKLAGDDIDPSTPVVLLHHLGLPDEHIVHTQWSEIDRIIEADHLTSLYIPHLAQPIGRELVAFHEFARVLREQCPWDKEQTHQSLVRYLIEETYEVVDALMNLNPEDPSTDDALIEELGDLLYQIEFHATIAEQDGRFTMTDVARNVREKLTRRHPHIFGHVVANSSGEVVTNWEEIKKAEKPERTGPFDGVIEGAPGLTYAQKVQSRAKRIGFDWPSVDGPLEKIQEESQEVKRAISAGNSDETFAEVGDLLFAVVNVARHLDIDAESALRAATQKFRGRVEDVQVLAHQQGREIADMTLSELDELWNTVKKGSSH